MDAGHARWRLKSLRRHAECLHRGIALRIDDLLKEVIDDGERGELRFLTKAVMPPLEKLLDDLKATERALEE